MGRNWVGFQTSPKSPPGQRMERRAHVTTSLTAGQILDLLISEHGLAQWLATPTAYTTRRGGSLEFLDGQTAFGGSFLLIDVPRRVILVTEQHGEIDLRVSIGQHESTVAITVKRLIADSENAEAVTSLLDSTLARLRDAMTNVG
ncbi:MAG: hypothetical protein ACYC3W_05970 [Candidatus Nanopelagicales bacterium]